MTETPFKAQLPQKRSLGFRPPVKPIFGNELTARCAAQSFKQNEELLKRIECAALE